VVKTEKLQLASCILILTTQDANSIVISNAHPKVHCSILNTSQLLLSTNFNIISGAVLNIGGITVLYSTVGGTGPEFIVPIKVWLLPYTSDI
jgi:hypothetical protein